MIHKITGALIGLALFGFAACNNSQSTDQNSNAMADYEEGSFGHDEQFLRKYDTGLVVLTLNDSKVIVSPMYQGKVFTSSAQGDTGMSFGWVNYKAFDEPINAHMNAYGGEDRFWLGPEGGPFSLYFKKGDSMVYDNWHTPPAIDTDAWQKTQSSDNKVGMTKEAQLVNYAGTPLKMRLDREVEILDPAGIASLLGATVPEDLSLVGFKTVNSITNTGTNAWTEETGAPCVWSLDMLMPSVGCVIIIPYNEQGSGKIATTDYFGEVPAERIQIEKGRVLFRADGKSRGKIGIVPQRVKDIAGSYDAVNNVLTIAKFDVRPDQKYLNQEWTTTKDPYSGDAMNAYNDGPLEDGSQMGPFYEIESVSVPAFLKPGEKLSHTHSLFHFTGDKAGLDRLAESLLGVSLAEVENAFQ